jgi:MerR family copper efflux transcriptional regulator
MRESPQRARKSVRQLTEKKLAEIEAQLGELKYLRDELRLLINLCSGSRKNCPIIREIDKP